VVLSNLYQNGSGQGKDLLIYINGITEWYLV